MHMIRLLLQLMAATAFIFLLAGLYKPWIMLWWEDVQNRRKVIRLYGVIGISCYSVYWILYFFVP
jgi:hypothetical protein